MNTKLFKSLMVLNDDNVTSLAQKLNLTRQTLALKIDGYSDFKQSEICTICKIYKLSRDDIFDVFFKECKGCDECTRCCKTIKC